jgi:hypothetical protein
MATVIGAAKGAAIAYNGEELGYREGSVGRKRRLG